MTMAQYCVSNYVQAGNEWVDGVSSFNINQIIRNRSALPLNAGERIMW